MKHKCHKCGKKVISEDHLTIYGLCGNCNEDAVKQKSKKKEPKVNKETQKRIDKLIPILNKIASEYLGEGK